MFATYEEMKDSHGVIKTFCAQHRYGLTVTAGVFSEQNGLVNRDDYIKFMNDLTIDEFTGKYLTTLLNIFAVYEYRKVINGEKGFYDFIEEQVGKDVRNAVQKYIEEH